MELVSSLQREEFHVLFPVDAFLRTKLFIPADAFLLDKIVWWRWWLWFWFASFSLSMAESKALLAMALCSFPELHARRPGTLIVLWRLPVTISTRTNEAEGDLWWSGLLLRLRARRYEWICVQWRLLCTRVQLWSNGGMQKVQISPVTLTRKRFTHTHSMI